MTHDNGANVILTNRQVDAIDADLRAVREGLERLIAALDPVDAQLADELRDILDDYAIQEQFAIERVGL